MTSSYAVSTANGRRLAATACIRLTGFGNVREIQALFPFPTVEQHPEETGYRACLKLLELMEKPETPPFVEELPVELIVP